MKKQFLLPVTAAAAGAVLFVLRLLQRKTAFESATGLAVKGHPLTIAPVILLLAAGIILFLLARKLPRGTEDTFPASFSTTDAGSLSLPVMGILLMLLSGCVNVLSFEQPDLIPGSETLSTTTHLLYAVTAAVPALAMFPAVSACRTRDDAAQHKAFDGVCLLAAPVCLVVRLVLSYRIYSINPVLQTYYAEVLALVLMTLAFYHLSSFAFSRGRSGSFAFYSSFAAVAGLAALGGSGSFPDLLLYGGGSLALLGFLLLYLQESPAESN